MDPEIGYVVFPGLFCAIVFIVTRIYLRYKKGIEPSFQLDSLFKDFSNGFVLPQFFELAKGLFVDQYNPNPTVLIMCVFYATFLVIKDLTDNGRSPRMRTRWDDPKD